GPVACGPLSGRRLPVDATGCGGGRAGGGGLRSFGRDAETSLDRRRRARTSQPAGVPGTGPAPEPAHPAHDGPALRAGAEGGEEATGGTGLLTDPRLASPSLRRA